MKTISNNKMHILLTGGAGYIGTHACLLLLESGYTVSILDNLQNSQKTGIARVKLLTGKDANFYKIDLRDKGSLKTLFEQQNFDAVMHFAGLKAVGDSVKNPLSYHSNNIVGTINLLQEMQAANVKTLVFSSSATVYGNPKDLPISESAPRSATNPYGRTKLIIEDILTDLFNSDESWKIACLRYFNPVGAHDSGLIGESPSGVPNNLMPFISQVASGALETLPVFGNDYPTPDGTGVRDYIHVMDLVSGHLAALQYLEKTKQGKAITLNLGTGKGVSVFEMITMFEKVSRKKIPYEIFPRRSGDIASCYADPSLAFGILNWKANKGLKEMCEDSWRWQFKNPMGYSVDPSHESDSAS
jgi:UDP-glucose 4-epimerase